jgi:hypothetical protein
LIYVKINKRKVRDLCFIQTKKMKKEISTSILIQAPADKVWEVLTDFDAYPAWNPFVRSLTGDVRPGNTIKVALPGMNFQPKVLAFGKNTELRWLGNLLFKGVFDGEHRFLLTANADGSTTFEHGERFSGILVRLFSRKLDRDTKPGFESMNQALKARVEESWNSAAITAHS